MSLQASDPDDEGSGYYLFGRDVMEIPCLRTSALAGFASAFGVGLLHFVFTSHASRSLLYAQLAFAGVMFPYCFYCQNERYENEYKMLEAAEFLRNSKQEEFELTDTLDFGHDTWG